MIRANGLVQIKGDEKYIIKHWFQDAKLNRCSRYFEGCDVARETEKAVLVRLERIYSSDLTEVVERWLPKAAVATREEYDAQIKADAQRDEDRKAAGLARWQKYYDFAKEHGVKGVSSKMRIVTIESKIKAAGIECPAF